MYLPCVTQEVNIVRKCFEQKAVQVLSPPATHISVAQVKELLQTKPAHVVHLACHGVQDVNPLESGFILHDGRLTIKDMMAFDMPNACMAFLSACQTAKDHWTAPDEAVHLAAAMLFCGFRSVIGTMWYVRRSCNLEDFIA